MTRRIERLADHEPPRVGIGDEDVVNFASVDVAAAGVHPHLVRRDHRGVTAFRRRRREDDCLEWLVGRDNQLLPRREKDGARPIGEHAAPRERPFATGGLERAASFLQDENGFFAGNLIAMRRAGREAQP